MGLNGTESWERSLAGGVVLLFLALLVWALWPVFEQPEPRRPTAGEEARATLACMVNLAEGDPALTVLDAFTVCTPFESGRASDTVAFHGSSVRDHQVCDFVVTTAGRYRPGLPQPCPPDRLAYLQRWAPVKEGSTEEDWIRRKRAELEAQAKEVWRRT